MILKISCLQPVSFIKRGRSPDMHPDIFRAYIQDILEYTSGKTLEEIKENLLFYEYQVKHTFHYFALIAY